jgi:hypothetical protein
MIRILFQHSGEEVACCLSSSLFGGLSCIWLVGHGCAMPIVSCLVAKVECHCSSGDFALASRSRSEVLVQDRSFRVVVAE